MIAAPELKEPRPRGPGCLGDNPPPVTVADLQRMAEMFTNHSTRPYYAFDEMLDRFGGQESEKQVELGRAFFRSPRFAAMSPKAWGYTALELSRTACGYLWKGREGFVSPLALVAAALIEGVRCKPSTGPKGLTARIFVEKQHAHGRA